MKSKKAVETLLERGVGTAIIFIELVRGCDNFLCPSWGKVCSASSKMHYMSEETLGKILPQILDCQEVLYQYDKVDIWPYGCGDPTKHPEFKKMLAKIRTTLPEEWAMSLSVDSHSRISCGDFAEYTRMKIMHKLPDKNGEWLERADWWNQEYGNQVQHGFITNTVSYKLWQDILSCGGMGTKKGRTFLTIPFGGTRSPDELPSYKRVNFRISNKIPVVRHLYTGALAKRTMFAWDGSLRQCLVAGTGKRTFRELLEEPVNRCARCFENTGGELINFLDDHVEVEEFACCVSDRPL